MASWKTDAKATQAARDAFPEHAPRVFRYGNGQYLLTPTPFGRMELIAVREGYLVAAERPPETEDSKLETRNSEPEVPEPLARHLSANGLRVWKTVPSHEAAEVIRSLGPVASAPSEPGYGDVWSPLLVPLATSAHRVGEARDARVQALARLLAARRGGDPIPELVGPDGVGKRTLVASLAAERGWAAVELPLARVLVERVFQTPIECFLELLLMAAGRLGDRDLLVVSDAELLQGVEEVRQRHMVHELSLLPRVCLTARGEKGTFYFSQGEKLNVSFSPPVGVVALNCPGLEGEGEVAALLAAELPEVRFEGAGLDLLVRAASLPGTGVVPARLLYLVRLAVALVEGEGGSPIVLAPDEAANVITLARPAWDAREADASSTPSAF